MKDKARKEQERAEQEAKAAEAKAQENEHKKAQEQADQAWLRSEKTIIKKSGTHSCQLLQEQEQQDAALNKVLLRDTVGKQLVGHDGQNCW